MEAYLAWNILGIEETKDEKQIRQAYREKLSGVNPEEDQTGFMRLREAYELALQLASQEEEAPNDIEALKDGDETDRWLYRISRIYEDVETRRNPAKWQEAFEADVCRELDLDLDSDIGERLLVFIMDHHYMPMEVWQTIDKKFHYIDDLELLKEKFPEDFLNYVKYKVNNEEFIDFSIFGEGADEHVDDYLYKYLDLKALCDRSDGSNLPEIADAIKVLEDYDVYHPYADVERMRYEIMTGSETNLEKAVKEADYLYGEYADNPYIAYYCGEAMEKGGHIAEAEQIWKKLLEKDENHYRAKYGLARIMADRGETEEAKEYCLDLMDIDDRNPELHGFLDRLNQKLIEKYEEQIKEQPGEFEIANKLAWCYFQMQEFEKVENLLQHIDKKYWTEYDYVNLIGRNYLAMDQYEKAMQYLPKWKDMIEATENDGSKEAHKRLRRRGFAYFAIAYCQWQQNLIPLAVQNFARSFELEEQFGVKLSYMDQLAQFYLEKHQIDEAIDICNQILALDRNYYPAYLKRQQAYYEQKNGQGVIDDYYAAIRLYAGYVKPYVLAYKIFYYYRQYEDAAGVFKKAEEAGLKSDEMRLYRLKIQRMTQKGAENWQKMIKELEALKNAYFANLAAIQKGEEVEESDLEEPAELFVELGLLYWNLDDTETAMQIVDEGISRYADYANLKWLKADIQMDIGQYAQALMYYKTMSLKDPDNPNVHINIGKCINAMNDGKINEKWEDALTEYKKAYELQPNHIDINFLLMRMYKRRYMENRMNREDYEKAVFHASAQLEITVDAYYYIERGLVYEEAHELEKALADFLKAAELEPDNIYAHNNAGNVYRKMRKFQEGLQQFEIALQLPNEEQKVWVYSNMADLYEAMGDYKQAVLYTTKQLETSPDNRTLLEDLARQYQKIGNYQQAIETYEKLRDKHHITEDRCMGEIAYCHYLSGAHRTAGKYYLKAIKIAEKKKKRLTKGEIINLIDRYTEYGDFCRDIGKFKDALAAYQKCVELAEPVDAEYTRDRFKDVAWTYYDMGNTKKAALYAKKFLDMIAKLSGDVETWVMGNPLYCTARAFSAATAYLLIGDLEQAEKYQQITKHYSLCPDCNYTKCYEAYFGEGLLLEAKGESEKAALMFQQALEIKPVYEESRRALNRVLKSKK